MTLKSLLSFVVVCVLGLSAASASAQPANSKLTFGIAGTKGFAIAFKADAAPVAPGYGMTSVNFLCGPVDYNLPHCLPTTSYTLTLVDTATGQPATWARIGKPVPQFAMTPGVPAGSTASFTAALNLPNTLAIVVDKNGTGAARSATFQITVGAGTITTLPTITVTQAGR